MYNARMKAEVAALTAQHWLGALSDDELHSDDAWLDPAGTKLLHQAMRNRFGKLRLVAASSMNSTSEAGNDIEEAHQSAESTQSAPFGDAVAELSELQQARLREHCEVMYDVRTRLTELQLIALSEGIELSSDSAVALLEFLRASRVTSLPFVFLMENGNVRAVWKNARREQIGLQFFPDGHVQYVIFASRSGNSPMARAAGRDLAQNIPGLISALNLDDLAIV